MSPPSMNTPSDPELDPFYQTQPLTAAGRHVPRHRQGAEGFADLDADRAVAARVDALELRVAQRSLVEVEPPLALTGVRRIPAD